MQLDKINPFYFQELIYKCTSEMVLSGMEWNGGVLRSVLSLISSSSVQGWKYGEGTGMFWKWRSNKIPWRHRLRNSKGLPSDVHLLGHYENTIYEKKTLLVSPVPSFYKPIILLCFMYDNVETSINLIWSVHVYPFSIPLLFNSFRHTYTYIHLMYIIFFKH